MRTQHHICDIPAQNIQPHCNHEEKSDSRNKGHPLHNWPAIFKSVNVMKAKKTLRIYLRLNEMKETWSPNRVPDLDPFAKTHIPGQLVKLVCELNGSNILILSSLC